MIVLATVLAGGVGASSRFVIARAAAHRLPPERSSRGIWLVNVSGAFLLGLLVGSADAGTLDGDVVRVLGTGFLGGFTTFSTWMVDITRGTRVGSLRRGTVELAVPLVIGLAAAGAGRALAGL